MRVLVAYSMSSAFTSTTQHYQRAFGKYLPADVSYLHVTEEAICNTDLSQFDVVINNFDARLCFSLPSPSYIERLVRFRGLKIIILQDEYDRTNTTKAAIKDCGFDIVLTCVPKDGWDYVYPPSEFPGVRFETVLAGYIPEEIPQHLIQPIGQRPITIGYRGRDLVARYGRLAFDKLDIGRRAKELCDRRNIKTDIAMSEASRLYGENWFKFIGSCRAMLGTESGSNVFDFDGSLEQAVKEMRAANSPLTYESLKPLIGDREQKINMGQASPRIFECAAMKTPMILFKGRYSDVVKEGEHYIGLEKDFSNFDAVEKILADTDALEALAERTYHHIMGSDRYYYRGYMQWLSELMSVEWRRKMDRNAIVISGAGHADIETAQEQDERLQVLTETPTPEPKGQSNFEILQEKLRFLLFRNEADRLGAAVADLSKEVRRLCNEQDSQLPAVKSALALADTADVNAANFSEWRSAHHDEIDNYKLVASLSTAASLSQRMEARYNEVRGTLVAMYGVVAELQFLLFRNEADRLGTAEADLSKEVRRLCNEQDTQLPAVKSALALADTADMNAANFSEWRSAHHDEIDNYKLAVSLSTAASLSQRMEARYNEVRGILVAMYEVVPELQFLLFRNEADRLGTAEADLSKEVRRLCNEQDSQLPAVKSALALADTADVNAENFLEWRSAYHHEIDNYKLAVSLSTAASLSQRMEARCNEVRETLVAMHGIIAELRANLSLVQAQPSLLDE